MTGSFTIRRATWADVLRIGQLHSISWRETYAGILSGDRLVRPLDDLVALWDRVLHDPPLSQSTRVLVAERSGVMVGFGACGGQRSPVLADAGFGGEVSALYVLQAAQRLGIGINLMAAMAADLAGRRFCGMGLWVLRENQPARRFYERVGGVVVGEEEDFSGSVPVVDVAYGWPDGARNTISLIERGNSISLG